VADEQVRLLAGDPADPHHTVAGTGGDPLARRVDRHGDNVLLVAVEATLGARGQIHEITGPDGSLLSQAAIIVRPDLLNATSLHVPHRRSWCAHRSRDPICRRLRPTGHQAAVSRETK